MHHLSFKEGVFPVSDIHSERILILDFGSQYTQLIARRVREAKVYCEIFPYNAGLEKVKAFKPKGLILSGGPSSVYDAGAPLIDKAHLELGVPGARHLLRHAAPDARARRTGG